MLINTTVILLQKSNEKMPLQMSSRLQAFCPLLISDSCYNRMEPTGLY